jgi:hypothetical protein
LALLPEALRAGVGFAAAPDVLPADRLNSGVLLIDPSPPVAAALLAAAGWSEVGEGAAETKDGARPRPVPPEAVATSHRIAAGQYNGDQVRCPELALV